MNSGELIKIVYEWLKDIGVDRTYDVLREMDWGMDKFTVSYKEGVFYLNVMTILDGSIDLTINEEPILSIDTKTGHVTLDDYYHKTVYEKKMGPLAYYQIVDLCTRVKNPIASKVYDIARGVEEWLSHMTVRYDQHIYHPTIVSTGIQYDVKAGDYTITIKIYVHEDRCVLKMNDVTVFTYKDAVAMNINGTFPPFSHAEIMNLAKYVSKHTGNNEDVREVEQWEIGSKCFNVIEQFIMNLIKTNPHFSNARCVDNKKDYSEWNIDAGVTSKSNVRIKLVWHNNNHYIMSISTPCKWFHLFDVYDDGSVIKCYEAGVHNLLDQRYLDDLYDGFKGVFNNLGDTKKSESDEDKHLTDIKIKVYNWLKGFINIHGGYIEVLGDNSWTYHTNFPEKSAVTVGICNAHNKYLWIGNPSNRVILFDINDNWKAELYAFHRTWFPIMQHDIFKLQESLNELYLANKPDSTDEELLASISKEYRTITDALTDDFKQKADERKKEYEEIRKFIDDLEKIADESPELATKMLGIECVDNILYKQPKCAYTFTESGVKCTYVDDGSMEDTVVISKSAADKLCANPPVVINNASDIIEKAKQLNIQKFPSKSEIVKAIPHNFKSWAGMFSHRPIDEIRKDFKEAVNGIKPDMCYFDNMILAADVIKIRKDESKMNIPGIKHVLFNETKKVTTVLFVDGTRVTSKAMSDDDFDPEVGFAMCIMKKLYGNRSKFQKAIKKYRKAGEHRNKKIADKAERKEANAEKASDEEI